MCAARLVEWCRIPTSGARAVEPFELDGMSLLAIPQLAYDQPGQPANMNGGDSDTDLVILRRTGNGYEQFQSVPAPGGEDAEFFRIGDRAFLATASIRSGAGPYRFATDSTVYGWTGSKFEPFQVFPGFAAKQWRHFTVADQHFLALAQGVALPATEAVNRPSHIFRWDGGSFQPFQDIPSRWAYNWHAFQLDGDDFLAHADHVTPSRLYRWDGEGFVVHQELAGQYGRAFANFHADGADYLLVACIQDSSRLLRWDGTRFAEHDVLDGPGAREFAVFSGAHGLYVARINFIHGTPAAPTTALTSQLYRWDRGTLTVVDEFPTFGGTDVAVYFDDEGILVAVSNSLSAEVRFATETVIYRFIE
jgi:EPTP domain